MGGELSFGRGGGFVGGEGYAVGALAEEDFEAVLVLRESLEILLGHSLLNLLFLPRIHDGHACPFEPCTTEPPPVHSIRRFHDLVNSNQFRRSTFIVHNRTLTTLEHQLPKFLHIPLLPCFHPFMHTVELCVEMSCPLPETLRHLPFMLMEHLLINIPQPRILQITQPQPLIPTQHPRRHLTLSNPHIEISLSKLPSHPAEIDPDFKGDICILAHQPLSMILAEIQQMVGLGLCIQIQQFVFLAEGDAALVKDPIPQPYVLSLGVRGEIDEIEIGELDTVHFGYQLDEPDQQSR